MRRVWGRMAITCVAVLTLSSVEAQAISGNEYRQLRRDERALYVIGVFEGWQHAYFYERSAPPTTSSSVLEVLLERLMQCVEPMTRNQMAVIVNKHLERNPAERDQLMPFIVWTALNSACTP